LLDLFHLSTPKTKHFGTSQIQNSTEERFSPTVPSGSFMLWLKPDHPFQRES